MVDKFKEITTLLLVALFLVALTGFLVQKFKEERAKKLQMIEEEIKWL